MEHSGATYGSRGVHAIAIGASAGGVEAVGNLLAALPQRFGPSLLVVIHMPANNAGLLAKVLAPRCALPVREAEDKDEIGSGTVYLAPPDYHLLVEPDRTLALSTDAQVNYARPSIDVLFESAAHAFRRALLAIVLSGANADGARGLAVVRASGGRAWVQDPASAQAPQMPASAIAQAGADRVLTLPDMCMRIGRLRVD